LSGIRNEKEGSASGFCAPQSGGICSVSANVTPLAKNWGANNTARGQ
jgi:hypothetical protein